MMDGIPELPTYMFELSTAGVISTLLTVVLPLLAGLVMRPAWSSGAKAVTLLALSAIKAGLEAWLAAANSGVEFDVTKTGYSLLLTFGLAVLMHFGLWKGTSVQQAAINAGADSRGR